MAGVPQDYEVIHRWTIERGSLAGFPVRYPDARESDDPASSCSKSPRVILPAPPFSPYGSYGQKTRVETPLLIWIERDHTIAIASEPASHVREIGLANGVSG